MKQFLRAKISLSVFAACQTGPIEAAPPPPSPAYVWEAGKILTDPVIKDASKIQSLFSNNVVATLNGEPVAQDKAGWLKWWSNSRRQYFGQTLGYSEGWKGSGDLLVLESYDTVDYSSNPPPIGDPRPSTRSTLYQFGPDHLIHSVQISEVNSFLVTRKR